MSNFDTARKALETSLNSSGSAMQEHAKWSESLEARLNKLKSTWQSLSQTFMGSDFLKSVLDGVIALVDGLDKLIDTFGVLPTLVGGFTAFNSAFNNKGIFKVLNTDLDGFINKVGIANKSFAELIQTYKTGKTGKGFKGIFGGLSSVKGSLGGLTKRDIANIQAYNDQIDQCVTSQTAFNRTMLTSSTAAQDLVTGANGGKVAMQGLTAATNASRLATVGATVATTAFNAALTMGISFLITAAVSGIMKLVNAKKELAEKVDEVTSKFQEQHTELVRNKSSFEAQATRYSQLAKGVNELGENVSLTADEYAEYQDVVNSIADQVPSLIQGYDSQGNAILNYKGNVEQLTAAYEELIKKQNDSVLKGDAYKDIEKDFKNAMEDAKDFGTFKRKTALNDINALEALLNSNDLDALVHNVGDKYGTNMNRIIGLIEAEGIDKFEAGDDSFEFIKENITKNRDAIQRVVDDFNANLDAEAEGMRSAAQAALSKAFDFSDSEYKNIDDNTQSLVRQIVGNFDAEQFDKIVDSGKTVEEYINGMLDSFKNMSKGEATQLEAVFDLQTKFNGGDISYGEYVKGLQDASNLINGLDLDENIKSQIKLSLGLSEKDGQWVLEEYETLLNRLTSEEYDIQLNTDSAENFLKNLNASEVQVAVDFIESDNADFKSALQNYKDVFDEAKEAGVDFSKTVFGNIDTNARQVLEWNSGNLKKFKDELMSWEPKDASWDKVKKEYEGAISTVMGTVSSYEIDGKEVDIAFSPMLQTDKGAEVLSSGTVNTYIRELISKATEDGKWSEKELIALDAKGLEVDGQKIKGILADIGETAQATGKQMHFVGKDGALALAEAEINAIVETQAKINEAMAFTTDIEVDTTALEALNTALTESASAMGLTEESIDSLKAKYSNLESFDAATLFEATANGVKVNREELAKLEKEYNDLTKSEVKEHIDSLTEAYNDATAEIDKCTNASERAQLLSKREGYMSQIEELAEYQAQLEGVTGAYQRWIDAQNTPEDYEGYESVATSREDIADEIDRGFISNASKEYIDLLSGKDLTGGNIDDYANAWEKLDDKVTGAGHSINDFFTVNDDGDITATGIDRFFKSVQTDFKGSIAEFDKETGKWQYNFSQENLQKIQDEWGIGIEAIGLLLEAAASAGYDVDWDGILDGIDLDTSNFETLLSYAEKAQKEFNELEDIDDVHFNFAATGVEEATSELEKARSTYIDLITNDDGTINLKAEGAEQMRVILSTLLVQKQQLEDSNIAINIDTSGLGESQQDIANAIEAVKTFREKYKNLEIAVTTGQGIDTAKSELSKAMGELQTLGGEGVDIAAQLILGEGTDGATLKTKVDAAIAAVGDKNVKVGCKLDETAIGALNSQLLTNFNPEATVKITGIDDTLVNQYTSTEKTAEGTVKWKNDESLVVQYQEKTKKAVGIVDWANNTENVKKNFSASGTVTWTSGNNVKVKVISSANGTANLNGTANSGRAFQQGDWGIKGSGTALVGELGMETLVRGGKFYTIGDTGAEFIQYRPNDIIFNHKQTEELFRYGKVLSDGGRGRVYANGSAFVDGGFPSSGKAYYEATASTSNFADKRKNTSKKKAKTETKTTTKDNSVTTTTTTSWSANASESNFAKDRNNKSSNSGSSSKSTEKSTKTTKEDFEETFDWIQIAIDRIERAIDNLDKKANNVYKTWSSRNKALTSEISKVGDEIKLQQQGYDRYIKEANSVGLSSSWAKKVREGKVDIQTIKDEALAEKIKDYQSWYEKALACKDAIEELKETESKLYAQRFENIQTQYDSILQGYEHTETMLNEYIAQAEEQGYIVSKKYYQALINNEKRNISQLKKEQSALIKARDEAVDNGKIAKNSEEWYKMCAEIDSVTQAIEEGTTALLEYDNAMREIDWSVFDLIQERISDITAESEFLIELMSNDKLFDDKGKLTEQGASTLGLHALNHNVAMYQSDNYGTEIAKLDKQIAKDPYDQELINRRRELVELQRESILEAENQKNAIRDLVEDGINLELDALQERIDLHNEELDSMKDLYDYQKNVEEQTKNIASLRKQLGAYEGFDDEETRAKVQELKVSLEEAETELQETEWDRYIDQQSQLLDTLYTEYESILNSRLDNIDYLLQQVIDGINATAGEGGTLTSALGAEGAIAQAIVSAVGENGSIKNILNAEATKVGTTLSSAMNNIWSVGDGNAKSILTTYGTDFQSKLTTTNAVLNSIKVDISRMVDDVDKDAQKKVTANKTSTSAKKDPTKNTTKTTAKKTTTTKKTTTKKSSGDGKAKVGDKVKFVSGQYYYDSQGKKPLGSHNLGKEVYITSINNKSWATHPYHISTGKKLGSGDLGWLKLNQLSGYASGKKRISNGQYAWTQENGQEYIIRPSDGAILTPVAKGDSILNATASGNIWSMANNPAEFIKDNLRLDNANIPNGANVNNTYSQHIDNVVFRMDNVKNYEEMLYALKDDRRFEKLVTAMTIDRIAGKSSLAKGKSIR